jgi:glutamate synthase (NADPH/NADH) large chain
MVELSPAMEIEDQDFIKEWLQKHLQYTGSAVAWRVLDRWHEYMPRFVKVVPFEYKRVLQEQRLRETDKRLNLIREEEHLGVAY